MLGELVRGTVPASICCALACVGIFNRLDLVVVAGFVLALWLLFSVVRLAMETAKGSYKGTANPWDRECFGFWLVALLSSLLAPVLYVMVASFALRHHSMP
jgi:hypothetical protein